MDTFYDLPSVHINGLRLCLITVPGLTKFEKYQNASLNFNVFTIGDRFYVNEYTCTSQ